MPEQASKLPPAIRFAPIGIAALGAICFLLGDVTIQEEKKSYDLVPWPGVFRWGGVATLVAALTLWVALIGWTTWQDRRAEQA